MGRQPAHMMRSDGKPRGRPAIWVSIRTLKRFTLAEIWHHCKEEKATIRTYLHALERGGYLTRDGFTPTRKNSAVAPIYILVRDTGVEAPRVRRDGKPCTQGRARENMWWTMRRRTGAFSYKDLAIEASTDDVLISQADARDYIKHLHKAGYLAVVCPALTGQKIATYRFVRTMNTGPRAPMIQRLQTVFDPNSGQVMWQQEASE